MSRSYTIAAVSKLTGISCHALRVWERRYDFPVPERSESGRRQYGEIQIRQLLAVRRELEHNNDSVSAAIAALKDGRLALVDASSFEEAKEDDSASMGQWVEDLLGGDDASAARWLDREDLDVEAKLQAIEAAMIDVGERWFRGECAIYQEHFASGFLRRRLSSIYDQLARAPRPADQSASDSSPDADAGAGRDVDPSAGAGPLILLGAVQGEHHEGGLMTTAIGLELAGWRTRMLGVDLPTAELERAVERWRPQALALSFALSRNLQKRFGELSRIQGVPVFVGGRIVLNHQSLARKFGLIPLAGHRRDAIRLLNQEWAAWKTARAAVS